MGFGGAAKTRGSRVRATRARAQELSEKAQRRLEQERERRLVVALGFGLADRSRQAAASVLAGALAFRFFLTLLPLTLVLVVGLGYLKSAGTSPSAALKEFGIRGVVASTINESAAFSNPGRTVVILLGVVAVLSSSLTAARTLRAIHALAWGIPVIRWRRRGSAGLLFLATVMLGFACGGLATQIRTAQGVVVGFAASLLLALMITAVWLGASLLLPRRQGTGWISLLPGSVLVGVGFALIQAVTVNWIGPKLDHEGALYGSLGVSFVVLGWLYAAGRLLVAAPLLNAAIADHQKARRG